MPYREDKHGVKGKSKYIEKKEVQCEIKDKKEDLSEYDLDLLQKSATLICNVEV